MTESIYYARFKAGFEAIPAENYVDYMTNVLPIREKHVFYLPWKGVKIICEVEINPDNSRELMWSLKKYDNITTDIVKIQVENDKFDNVLECLRDSDLPKVCEVCNKSLGALLRFF